MDGYVYIYDYSWDFVRISTPILALLYFQCIAMFSTVDPEFVL